MPIVKAFLCESGLSYLEVISDKGSVIIEIRANVDNEVEGAINLSPEDITELIEELKAAKAEAEDE